MGWLRLVSALAGFMIPFSWGPLSAQDGRAGLLGFERPLTSRDPYDKICIHGMRGYAMPVPNSPSKLFAHFVSFTNDCFKKLRVKVCYKNTNRCKVADLKSGGQTEIALGFEPNNGFFLVEFREVPLNYSE